MNTKSDISNIKTLIDIAKRLRKITNDYEVKGKELLKDNAKGINNLSIEIIQAGLNGGYISINPIEDEKMDSISIRSKIISEQIKRIKSYGIFYHPLYFNYDAEDIIFKILSDESIDFNNSEFDILSLYYTIVQKEEFLIDKQEKDSNYHAVSCSVFKSTYYNTLIYLKMIHPELFESIDIEWMIHN